MLLPKVISGWWLHLILLSLSKGFHLGGRKSTTFHYLMRSAVQTENRRSQRSLLASHYDGDFDSTPLIQLLQRYRLHDRLITLPVHIDSDARHNYWVEIYINGSAQIARLEELQWPSSDGNMFQEPNFLVSPVLAKEKSQPEVVDLGQVTSIWRFDNDASSSFMSMDWNKINQKAERIPRSFRERLFDRIYATTVRKGRSSSLTKKKIPAEAARIASHSPFSERESFDLAVAHTEQVLRKVQKTGPGFARLMDSQQLADSIMNSSKQARKEGSKTCQALSSVLLAHDSKEGGRFKRWPTVMVERNPSRSTVTLLNGGWLVQDQSVRTGLEVEKMISRSSHSDLKSGVVASDDRIGRRLECLAMGETIFDTEEPDMVDDLHSDVKRTLAALGLPLTPSGAQEALLKLGRWSNDLSSTIEPWSSNILEAASKYAKIDMDDLANSEKDRVDLTNLPCLCIDAKGTTFRDDALGIRPRQGTGRHMDPLVSKWEVLVHIADLSDIYTGNPLLSEELQSSASLLKKAAESRGTSRYDLPLGPLHLMPPVVLRSLSFSTKKTSQRAVTLWVYIDERDGKVVDAGIERTIVSKPTMLSYSEAASLLNDPEVGGKGTDAAKVRVLVLAIEKILRNWSSRRLERSNVARQREARFASRVEDYGDSIFENEDQDFERTRAHRLVDAALDLYAYSGRLLLNRAKAPIPFARGAGQSQGARVATAPLRRYIDGECQRQLLAVCLGFGTPLDAGECRRAGRIANESRNKIRQVRAAKRNTRV